MDETPSNYYTCCAEVDGTSRRCGMVALKSAPIPLCLKHVNELLDFYREELGEYMQMRRVAVERTEQAVLRSEERRRQREMMTDQSVVYYVRIGDVIKIGYTKNLRKRLGQLRVYDEDLLATEPGARQREVERHAQFKAERLDRRREDFRPTEHLMAHITGLVEEHGTPTITSYRGRAEKRRFKVTVSNVND